MERPHRAFELDIHIGGDTWDEVIRDLKYLAEHVEDHGPTCSSVCGGPSGNHIVTVTRHPDMTHERYHEQNDAYLASKATQAKTG